MIGQGLFKRRRLLTERQAELLSALRALLEELQTTLERFGADVAPGDLRALQDTLAHLDELFLLVIAGEFNSGKSSFINALLGAPVLAEGVTPTTDRITLVRYGDEQHEELQEAIRDQTYPADMLRQLTIVDTPGTNAVIRRHEELTRSFIPRADLVLFTTSSDRPFTESERAFLALIKEWGKKIVLILNKIDILQPSELDQVIGFVRTNARELLGSDPEVFPVSARLARRARDTGDEQAWTASRFEAVERYVVETLDEETRVRLKLLSPLGVANRITNTYLKTTEERLATLRDDLVTLDNIDQQLALFREDMQTDVQYHLNEIDTVLRDLEERGHRFFDETIRITRLPDLLNSDRMRMAFEQEVVGDLTAQIDQRVNALIDWMISKDLRAWQSIVEYINRRRAAPHRAHLIGEIGGSFDYNRGALIESVGQRAGQVIGTYDKEYESQTLADEVRASVAATAITQVGAVGLGALLVALFHTVWLDVTGVLAASLVALGGFYLLPAKRRQAKKALSERISDMKSNLRQTIDRQLAREIELSQARIREAVAPYTRFVRSQRDQLTSIQVAFSDLDVKLERLKSDIG